MARFLAWRLVAMVITVVVALSAVFFGMMLVPGDAAQSGLGQSNLTLEQIEERRAAFGLDLPPAEQYFRYLNRSAHGDLGVSWMSGQSVSVMIGQQIGPSLALTVAALLIAAGIGLPLGILSVYGGHPVILGAVQAAMALAVSTPVMISGTILVLVFALMLHWLPATGQDTPAHLILPAAAVGVNVSGSLAKAIEAGLAAVKDQPFSHFARAKGLTRWQTLCKHILPVGLLPVLEMLTLQMGYLFSGAVVTENLFARQGLGSLLVAAILNKDTPAVLGVVFASIIVYSLLHLAAEIGYAWLDPRVRTAA